MLIKKNCWFFVKIQLTKKHLVINLLVPWVRHAIKNKVIVILYYSLYYLFNNILFLFYIFHCISISIYCNFCFATYGCCHPCSMIFIYLYLYIFFRWYFGKIKRIEAEKKLLLPQNEHGAYLIRDSESRRNDYSLSVRDGDTVKHYRIRQLDEGGFFIARRTTFRWVFLKISGLRWGVVIDGYLIPPPPQSI